MTTTPQQQSRRRFMKTCVKSSLAVGASTATIPSAFSAKTDYKRPNIVLIMADDLGYGDLSCYDASDLRTPNIDHLATEGVRLTDYYASAPVCTPTRCALMTGRYQQRVGNMEWALYAGIHNVGLPKHETTIATMLKDAGYSTAMFGKWHLGHQEPWMPTSHGFDEFFGFLSGNIDYFKHIESTQQHDLYEGTEPVHKKGYITDLITERSVEYISKQSKKEDATSKPFFLYVSYNAPHWPMQGPDDETKKITPGENWSTKDRSTLIKMVERMDQGIGQIVEALKQSGQDENTLLVFISDNGGDRSGDNSPFRGKKAHLWEGGIRVPCIFRWPNMLEPGRVSSQAAITMDISTSILNAARVKPSRKLEGISLLPYISGDRPDVEQTFVWRNGFHDEVAVRWGHWKWLRIQEKEYLFNLAEDPGESENRMDRNIDIVFLLRQIYDHWENAMPHNQTIYGQKMKEIEQALE